MQYSKRILLVLLLGIFLQGCELASPPQRDLVELQKQAMQQLQQQDVLWIETGETITVAIPTDRLFYPDSANLKPPADKILKPLTFLLSHCESTMTRIGAFTDNQGSWVRNKALSEKQAQRLVAYFTKQGIDTRLLYAVGYGSAYPIADNSLPTHAPLNNRIEIKFRYVVLPPLV